MKSQFFIVLGIAGLLAGCGSQTGQTGRGVTTAAAQPSPSGGGTETAFAEINTLVPPPTGTGALETAKSAMQAHPGDADANLAYGFAAYKVGAFEEAMSGFEKVTRLRPKDWAAYRYLAYARMGGGELDPAIADWENLARQTGVPPAEAGQAFLEIGNIYLAQTKDEKAADAFRRSLAVDKRQGQASLALGAWSASRKRFAEARGYFERAVQTLPPGRKQARAWAALGQLAEDQNDKAGALKAYRKALSQDQNNAGAEDALKRLAGAAGTKR